jgi:hypothetical protein
LRQRHSKKKRKRRRRRRRKAEEEEEEEEEEEAFELREGVVQIQRIPEKLPCQRLRGVSSEGRADISVGSLTLTR